MRFGSSLLWRALRYATRPPPTRQVRMPKQKTPSAPPSPQPPRAEAIRHELHAATLYLMGYVARLGGKANEDEVQLARIVIVNCLAGSGGGRSECERLLASFKRGTTGDGEWGEAVQSIQRAWGAGAWTVDFRADALNSLVQMANIGGASWAQHQTLTRVAEEIGVPWDDFRNQVVLGARPAANEPDVATARTWLGVSPNATRAEVNAAYRRLRRNYRRLSWEVLPAEVDVEVRQSLRALEQACLQLREASHE